MIHLTCINCGAVYRDRWAEDESPTCPYCGCSHYSETEEEYRKPTKKHYKVSDPRPLDEKLKGRWCIYWRMRQGLDVLGCLGDEQVIHDKALRLSCREGCPFMLCLRAQVVDETLRKRRHEVLCPFDVESE